MRYYNKNAPVPGDLILGRYQNKGQWIPRVKWACEATVVGFNNYNCVEYLIHQMWGSHSFITDHLKINIGDKYSVGKSAFTYSEPKVGDRVLITTEHYVTDRGHDQYGFVGEVIL